VKQGIVNGESGIGGALVHRRLIECAQISRKTVLAGAAFPFSIPHSPFPDFKP
jgi:hypothetical protein